MKTRQPLLRGASIELGGTTYTVPPLNFRQLRDLEQDLLALGSVTAPGNLSISAVDVGRIVKVVHAALSRNYPDITIEEVEELVDLGNAKSLMAAVAGVSGLEQEVAPLGEAPNHLTGVT
jgi:hypothetical protein